MKILYSKYGYSDSHDKKMPFDGRGLPIPWYTYAAIEYLSQLDLSKKNVFEYGVGNSSLFFARKCNHVTSVEDNVKWFEKISVKKPHNLDIQYEKEKMDYLSSIAKLNKKFDILSIDASHRDECCRYVKDNLAPGGLVILDNSDWYVNAAHYLRTELNMLQVDFFGFGPINNYTWCTSLFFDRSNTFGTTNNAQPHMPIGGIKKL